MGRVSVGGGGGMRAGVGGEVSKYKNTPVPFSATEEKFFSEPRDESGLSAIRSVR